MGNKTTAAIGTALQFEPQPDRRQTENLNGITGIKGSVSTGDVGGASIVSGLDNLMNAYGTYMLGREKRFKDAMFDGATNMINSASEEDLQRLTSIEIAQKYGYATLVDNPYFDAMTSNMRGIHAADLARAEYNALYGDDRAATPEEEQKRFDEFMVSKKQGYNSVLPSLNEKAFREGFDTKSKESLVQMMQNRSQFDVANRLMEAQQGMKAQLDTLVYNASSMTVDDVISAAQPIFNEARLVNMEPEVKYKLVNTFASRLASTGRFSAADISKIMDKVEVETRLDGTKYHMSDFVGKMELGDAATAWQKTHLTKFQLDILSKYANDKDLSRFRMDKAKLYMSKNPEDRQTADIMEALEGKLHTQQTEKSIAREKAEAKAAAKMKEAAINEATKTAVRANIQMALDGSFDALDAYGNRLGNVIIDGKTVDSNTVFGIWWGMRDELLSRSDLSDGEKLEQMQRLMQYPGVSSFRNEYENRMLDGFKRLKENDLDNGLCPASVVQMYNMYRADPDGFSSAFGDNMSAAFGVISMFADNSGESDTNAIARGVYHYVVGLHKPPEEKAYNKQQVDTYYNDTVNQFGEGPDIDGILELGSEAPLSISPSDSSGRELLTTIAEMYMNAGETSVADAYNHAEKSIANDYWYYYGAFIPKNLFYASPYNSGDIGYEALHEMLNAAVGGDGLESGRHSLTYNPKNRTLSLFDNYSGSIVTTISEGELANEMAYIANNR